MAKAKKRENTTLKCSECGEHNYISTRNKKTHPQKLEIMKFCSRCGKQTVHRETR